MGLEPRILTKVDSRLRTELRSRNSGLTARVPVTPEQWAVWKRYCDLVGVSVGAGLAVLVDHELASVVDDEIETLTESVKSREAAVQAREAELAAREEAVTRREESSDFRERQLESLRRRLGRERTATRLKTASPRTAGLITLASDTAHGSTQTGPQPGMLVQFREEVQELSSRLGQEKLVNG